MNAIDYTTVASEVLAKIVTQIGAIFTTSRRSLLKTSIISRQIDIGVLRVPDVDQPYFKVYHIKPAAWSDSSSGFVQGDTNGITGAFNGRIFRPHANGIEHLSFATFQMAANDDNDALFDDWKVEMFHCAYRLYIVLQSL
ncbi:hypothetical protein GGI35DRAFT_478858 [Trichoderma velutinum]